VRLETRTVLREILRASTEAANAPLAREALRSLGGDAEAEDLNAVAAALKARTSEPAAPADEALRQQLQFSARLIPAAQVLVEPGAASGEQALQTGGDAAAGRRVFYHPTGARCFSCHTIEGRGTAIGPDLTQMGRFTPEQIAEAIIHPSKEIAPAYVQWLLKLRDGREVSGINLFEDNKSAMTLLDATGTRAKYQFKDMLSREELPVSLMPPGLEQQMTPQDLRDLIAYLRESRD
jgi:putative heme-binding domain-containing protein